MKANNLDQLRVASPCPISWEQMSGNDRVRYCQVCNLNVYNIAELTHKEATALVTNSEGRICARLFRRSDGTVITRDCPVGLRAIRRRVARMTGAVFATVVALSSAVLGQKPNKKEDSACKQQVSIARKSSDGEATVFSGTIIDPQGAVVAGAQIKLIERQSQRTTEVRSNDDGTFLVTVQGPGTYEVLVESAGFKKLQFAQLLVAAKETVTLTLTLAPATTTVLVGMIGVDPMIDITRPGGTTIITREMIERLPIPR